MKKIFIAIGILTTAGIIVFLVSFKPIKIVENEEMRITVYPGPTIKHVDDQQSIEKVINIINKEKKSFNGFNFESGGWIIGISYNHTSLSISNSHIRVGPLQYKASPDLLTDLMEAFEDIEN